MQLPGSAQTKALGRLARPSPNRWTRIDPPRVLWPFLWPYLPLSSESRAGNRKLRRGVSSSHSPGAAAPHVAGRRRVVLASRGRPAMFSLLPVHSTTGFFDTCLHDGLRSFEGQTADLRPRESRGLRSSRAPRSRASRRRSSEAAPPRAGAQEHRHEPTKGWECRLLGAMPRRGRSFVAPGDGETLVRAARGGGGDSY